jgi:hypothetical protein
MIFLTRFLFTGFAFSDYSEAANTIRAASRRFKPGCFTLPKNYNFPIEWSTGDGSATLIGGRNSIGIFFCLEVLP